MSTFLLTESFLCICSLLASEIGVAVLSTSEQTVALRVPCVLFGADFQCLEVGIALESLELLTELKKLL